MTLFNEISAEYKSMGTQNRLLPKFGGKVERGTTADKLWASFEVRGNAL